MKLFEYKNNASVELSAGEVVDLRAPVIVSLPGVIPTPELFHSYDEIKGKAPEFHALVDAAKQKCQEHNADTWGIGVFGDGLHDIIVKGFFNITKAVGGDELLKPPVGRISPVRLLTISTDSVEENVKNMHAVIRNPEGYVSDEMNTLGEQLFRKNIFDDEGKPRNSADINKRMGNLTLFAISLGNTQAVELETKLYALLKEAKIEGKQADEVAANVNMVGMGCFFKCLNGKSFDHHASGDKGILKRSGFTKAIYEAAEDVYTNIFSQRKDAPIPEALGDKPIVTPFDKHSVHVLFHTPAKRTYRDPNSGAQAEIEDYTFHRPESVGLPDISYTAGSADDQRYNTVPRMVSAHLKAAVQARSAADMQAVSQAAGVSM